jgi:hypothetical protein
MGVKKGNDKKAVMTKKVSGLPRFARNDGREL